MAKKPVVMITGLEELQAKLNALDSKVRGPIRQETLDKTGELVQTKQHDRCPVKGSSSADGFYVSTARETDVARAGAVRKSIKREVDEQSVTIGTNHMLAKELEYGGKRGESARPFIRWSLDGNKLEVNTKFATELQRLIEGAV